MRTSDRRRECRGLARRGSRREENTGATLSRVYVVQEKCMSGKHPNCRVRGIGFG